VVQEFVDVGPAKVLERKQFAEMVRFLEGGAGCRIVLAETTDRLYRDSRDLVRLADLDVEIHFPKEGSVTGRNAKSKWI
jgi:site-specific DNA recombinase